MITIPYTVSSGAKVYDAFLHDVLSGSLEPLVTLYGDWLLIHGALLSSHNNTIFSFCFEDGESAIMFKLKFGL